MGQEKLFDEAEYLVGQLELFDPRDFEIRGEENE